MARRASSPACPVAIMVSSGGKGSGDGALRRSIGLTSPVPRHYSPNNNPHSPAAARPSSQASSGGGARYCLASKDEIEETGSEFVRYTVHIPPTPDHPMASESETRPERSYISGTIFTGGFNCVTRGHVMECSADSLPTAKSAGMVCRMKGCDGAAFLNGSKLPCECGFMICNDCYLECVGSGGQCPGCKEPYGGMSDEEDSASEAEEKALPLTSMKDFRAGRRLSMIKSTKAPNQPADFDHNRWLFETKGTYGYGNAVWPKDGHGGEAGFKGFEEPPNFGGRCRRPLTRKVGVSQAILSPYR